MPPIDALPQFVHVEEWKLAEIFGFFEFVHLMIEFGSQNMVQRQPGSLKLDVKRVFLAVGGGCRVGVGRERRASARRSQVAIAVRLRRWFGRHRPGIGERRAARRLP